MILRRGPEHPNTLTSAINLTGVLYTKGKHNEAEVMSWQALVGSKTGAISDDCGLSDSDPDTSNDDDGYSSEDEHDRSIMGKNVP
jgi:hypothetical protein